jgi:DNA adenine methylase|tara:strand:- start:174 stop:1061 length:888 start_codon:yes stop_codon:yes gene_type:complete
MKTLLRYAGGKSKAVKKIGKFADDYDTIISPFIGGGSLEVHWASNGKKVHAYDIFDVLVNFWQVLLTEPESLSEEMLKISATKEEYAAIKELLISTPQTQELLSSWKTDHYRRKEVTELSPEVLAAYYYFNHNCSYGPAFLGWASSLYMKQDKWEKQADKVKKFKCENLSVACGDFSKAFEEHPKDFFYLDPPYYLRKDADNKMFKGIYPMRNIPVHHDGFPHEKLRDLLLQHEGDFVLSYNNCETIREYYKDFDFYFPSWSYSMGNGETRIGKNRSEHNKATKESHEILIVKKS